jgi:predicted metal-dependent enzyme (double-stranded beta helix superfamily)
MADAKVFVALDPIYGRSYGLADRLDHGQATVRVPARGLGGDAYEVDLDSVVPPGARILRLMGNWIGSGGPLPASGYWIGDAANQGTGIGAAGAPYAFRWCFVGNPNSGSQINTIPLFDDWSRKARVDDGAGAFITAAGVPVAFMGSVEWELISGLRMGCFADTGDGVPPEIGALVAREVVRLKTPGDGMARIGVMSGNRPNDVISCNNAYPRGDNNYHVRAGDIGANPWQIPTLYADNTPERFRNFPGTFLRANMAIRGVHHPARFPWAVGGIESEPDPGGIAESGVRIWICNRAPTHSRWTLRIDSELHDVIVKHPDGSDFRTAREIWNNVIAEAINTGGGLPGSIPIYAANVAATVRTFYQVGELRATQYIQGGTFWEGMDALASDQDPMYTLYTQGPIA